MAGKKSVGRAAKGASRPVAGRARTSGAAKARQHSSPDRKAAAAPKKPDVRRQDPRPRQATPPLRAATPEPPHRRKPLFESPQQRSTTADPASAPVRVAIVGGGCAGLAAAWELSRIPGYQVDVYERSFRLGGKGASGRDENGRIHEHGLHLWLGFYENAFRMMRECYAQVQANDWGPHRKKAEHRLAHASIDDAFFAEPRIGVAGLDADDVFKVWSGYLPPAKGLPGDAMAAETNPYTLANYLMRCLQLVKTLVQSTVTTSAEPAIPDEDFVEPANAEELVERIAKFVHASALTSVAAMLQAVTLIERWVSRLDDSQKRSSKVLKVLVAVAAQVRKLLANLVGIDADLRWKTEIVDIVLAIAVGLVRDRVLFTRKGFDAINDLDYRAWLAKHGATQAALDSRFIEGIYQLVFAFEDGNLRRPAFAAGVALRSALRMFFTYRGSMFWRLRSGMGDAVFAPLYKAMLAPKAASKQGPAASAVRFHLLHELERIQLEAGPDGRLYVTGLSFTTTGDPALTSSARPTALDHFGCWPDDDRLLQGAEKATAGKLDLDRGEHFDAVIMAMGVDDFVSILRGGASGPGLFAHLPDQWSRMAETTRTVATQSAQVWLDADFESLGWQQEPGVITALGLVYETWADMTHTLATERAWRKAKGLTAPDLEAARSVGYLCSVLPDREFGGDQKVAEEVAAKSLLTWLQADAEALWPRCFENDLTAVDRLVDPAGRIAKFDTLRPYVRANATRSERYTLSVPGSIAYRVSPLDRSVANMRIAGDWTACGLDAGCVEAAVISGKLAAHAVTGHSPALESIVGYDHP